ncbi:hypothetical protein AJ78_08074 [Emergomyces pasteurianus Ep9510]|uniref:Uncharacterized protein n=1 Tax=Emergomyces pasteurianus Ep9510 TaxID=1447872 RepID=A0A1J9P2U7_9EURO|nr:hypothetical protein AJ78_08074 [Emergomyces pasteurianus Ep9510]
MPEAFVESIRKDDTIYRDETGFDNSFRIHIDFARVEFVETLKESGTLSIFYINYYKKSQILKVFHNIRDSGLRQRLDS